MATDIHITPQNVLIYYDYPELFIGVDQIETRYICLLAEELEHTMKYICCPVSINKMNNFINGEIDLLSIYREPEKEPLYYLETKNDFEFASPKEVYLVNVPAEHFPEEGFLLPPIEQDDKIIIDEAYDRNRLILHLIIKESDESNVSLDLLSDLLANYQKMIKYAFKNSLKKLSSKAKSLIDHEKHYQLKAFASSPGSFNIHIESLSSSDLFGNYEITSALKIIDEIMITKFDRDYIMNKLIDNRGYFIGSLSKFLDTMVKQNISLLYNWSTPMDKTVVKKSITNDYAKKIYDLIKERSELGIEEKILTGSVEQADVKNGKWRLLNTEDNIEYKGIASSVSLAGIVLKDQIYEFTCEEIFEEESVTGKDKTILNLIKIKEIN